MHAARKKADPDAFSTTYRQTKSSNDCGPGAPDRAAGATPSPSPSPPFSWLAHSRPLHTHDDGNVGIVQAAATSLPVRSFDAMNEWLFRLCNVPASNSAAAGAVLDALAHSVTHNPALLPVLATARAWLLFVDAAATAGGGVRDGIGTGLESAAVPLTGVEAPEALALD